MFQNEHVLLLHYFKMNKSDTWLHSSFPFSLHFHLQRMQRVRNYKGKYRKLEVKPGSYVKNKKENKIPNRVTHNEFQHKHLLYRQLLKILKVLGFCFSGYKACRILVPQPGTEPVTPAKEVWSLNH